MWASVFQFARFRTRKPAAHRAPVVPEQFADADAASYEAFPYSPRVPSIDVRPKSVRRPLPNFTDPSGLALVAPLASAANDGHTRVLFHRIDGTIAAPEPPAGCGTDTVSLSTVAAWCTDFVEQSPEAPRAPHSAPSLVAAPLGPQDSGEHGRRAAQRRVAGSLARTPRLSSAWFRLSSGCTPDDESEYDRSLARFFTLCDDIDRRQPMRTSLGRASRNTIQFTTVAAAEFPHDTTTGRRNAA